MVKEFIWPGIGNGAGGIRKIALTHMLRNYLTIAYRSLTRTKVNTSINIVGLSIGICCCVLISLFVKDELTFDRFHKNADRIHRVYAIEDWGDNQRFVNMTTPFPMGPALKLNLEEVELMVRINDIRTQVKTDREQFSESVTIAGVDFLRMFDFELIHGQRDHIFTRPEDLLITSSTAKKFFGDGDPTGKHLSLKLNETFEDFTIRGVVNDPPANSSIRFSMVISELNYPKLYSEKTLTSAWFNITPETYVQLRSGVSPEQASAKFPSVFKPLLGDNYEKSKYFVGLQPLTAIHLDTSLPVGRAPVSDPKYSYILSAVALLILVVGCINFVTLSIGRSLKRSKEVGIRKVAGAQKHQLVTQFIGEAIFITAISLLLGLALTGISLPLFNDLSGKELNLQIDGFFVGLCACLVLVIGLFAGSYPALVLSGFKPVSVLKGLVSAGSSKQTTRKILVGIQLTLSIFLISSTLLMRHQLEYLRSKNLGFDKEQLGVIQLNVPNNKLIERVNAGFRQAENFKVELNRIPGVVSVCGSSHDFANGDWMNVGYTDEKGVYRTFYYNTIDADYSATLRIEFAAGRNFDDDVQSDKRRAIIVNEAFVNSMGWSEAIGRRIPGSGFGDHEIIGVMKDFNFSSLYTKVTPLVLAMDPAVIAGGIENININNSPVPKLLVRFKAGEVAEALSQIRVVWDKLTGGEQFSFSFVDQALDEQYRNDQTLGKIVSIATMLALIIGSMGLYGLASLAMQNRVKEISIRKVLGATRSSILLLLSKDYVFMILGSLVVSVPFTVLFIRNWLTTFEYRVSIGAGVFLIAGGVCMLVALCTISFEAYNAASKQPADTLKHE